MKETKKLKKGKSCYHKPIPNFFLTFQFKCKIERKKPLSYTQIVNFQNYPFVFSPIPHHLPFPPSPLQLAVIHTSLRSAISPLSISFPLFLSLSFPFHIHCQRPTTAAASHRRHQLPPMIESFLIYYIM